MLENARTALLLDNTITHQPSEGKLCNPCSFLCTTSVVQLMDEGVIESTTKQYRNLYLQQCLMAMEDGKDTEKCNAIKGKKTMDNLKNYTLKDNLNSAEAWEKIFLASLKMPDASC